MHILKCLISCLIENVILFKNQISLSNTYNKNSHINQITKNKFDKNKKITI